MQLRVFILGLGAALVAGTIWFAASAEDGKGFGQQASAQPPEAAKQEPAQPGTEAAPANEPGLGVEWAAMEGYLKQIDSAYEFSADSSSMDAQSSDSPTVMLEGPINNIARATVIVGIWNPKLSQASEDNKSTLKKLSLIVARLAPRWHSKDMTDWLVRNFFRFSHVEHTTSDYEISWEVGDPLDGTGVESGPGELGELMGKVVKKGTLRIAPIGGGRQSTEADFAEFRKSYEECQAWVRSESGGAGLGLDVALLKARLARIDWDFTYKALGQGVTCASSSDGVQVFFFVESSGNVSAALVRHLKHPTPRGWRTMGIATDNGWMETFHRAVIAVAPRWGPRELEEYGKWYNPSAEVLTTSISDYRLVSKFYRYKNDFLMGYYDWVVGVASQTGRSSADE